MAGSGMRDIKRRIKSVNSTKQITKAMELVATAKLRRVKDRVEEARPYFNEIQRVIQNILSTTKGINHPYLEVREAQKSLYIVISADRGLAGGYNANLIKAAVNHMEGKNPVVITAGQKARDYFKRRGYSSHGEFTGISENPKFFDAKSISSIALELYNQKVVDEVYVVYTQFLTTIQQRPVVAKLLPAEIAAGGEEKAPSTILYEPSAEEVFEYLIPKYVESTIFGAMVESAASEQGARRTAMESATDNAQEMIDDLTLSFNRARQATITKELSEIVGGAEALK
jgi:F-type H+-transporting ATPase subunit gamma